MTANQASLARAGLPAAQAATTRPHDPADHPAIGCRPTDLPLVAARKKIALYAPLLLGAAAAAVLALAGSAMASPVTGHDATSTGDLLDPRCRRCRHRRSGYDERKRHRDGLPHATADGANTLPFLYQGPLTSAADDSGFHALTPPFKNFKTGTFYGPDTSTYNPDTIPARQVRAVGSYRTGDGVFNHGMIYLGPVSGGGTWTTIDVPADGSNTAGGVRACPSDQPGCVVMDTIAHSTMGNLVVGQLRPQPRPRGVRQRVHLQHGRPPVDAAPTRRKPGERDHAVWHLAERRPRQPELHPGPRLSAHGSSLRTQRAFLMNYNERTGHFGPPRFYTYGNAPALVTHFDGITAVPGGFNLATISSAQTSSMAFVPTTGGIWPLFGRATWYPIDVAASRVCKPAGCSMVTGNTVFQNQVMGLYVKQFDGKPRTYLATVPTP